MIISRASYNVRASCMASYLIYYDMKHVFHNTNNVQYELIIVLTHTDTNSNEYMLERAEVSCIKGKLQNDYIPIKGFCYQMKFLK